MNPQSMCLTEMNIKLTGNFLGANLAAFFPTIIPSSCLPVSKCEARLGSMQTHCKDNLGTTFTAAELDRVVSKAHLS